MKTQLVDARSERDFERGHFAGAVSLAPDAVVVFAERELANKAQPLLVYAAKLNDQATQATVEELRKSGFEHVQPAPFGFDDNPEDLKIEVGPARWEILGCGG